jgi:hypothetical protein
MNTSAAHEFSEELKDSLERHLAPDKRSNSARNLAWAMGAILSVYLFVLGHLTAWAIQTEQTRYRASDAAAAHVQIDRVWDAKFESLRGSLAHQLGLIVDMKSDVKEIRDRLRETEKRHVSQK